MSVYRRSFAFVRPHVGHMIGVMAANLTAAILDVFSFTLLIPFLNALFDQPPLPTRPGLLSDVLHATVGALLDPADKMGSLRNTIALILIAVTLKNAFVWLGGQLGATLQERVVRDLRGAVFGHLLRLPLDWFTRTKAGQILTRVQVDTGTMKQVITELVTRSILSGAQVLATIVALFSLSWQLTLYALIVAPAIIGALQPLLRRLRRGFRRVGNEAGELTSTVQETVAGMRLLKAYRAEPAQFAHFTTLNERYTKQLIKVARLVQLSQPITETLGTIVAVALLWIGAQQVLMTRTMNGADLITFLVLVIRLLQPLKQLSQVPTLGQQSLASAERVFEILDAESETARDRGQIAQPTFAESITFEDVSFSYPPLTPDEPPGVALQGIRFTARKGEVIALVGPSGAGKSTLVDLLPRFIEPARGTVRIDGVDTREITLPGLRRLMGIVSQDTVLFNDSVRANLTIGRADQFSHAQVEAAARAANAHGFISQLPDGYDTVLGERGTRLSGGQRQRLAIARALLLDPPILVLDEATSALDTESERLVQEAIDRLLTGRTVFVIAHRLSTIAHADRILVLDAGRLVEQGSHATLLAAGGLYARLHAMQFRDRPLDDVMLHA
ncbi:MAG: ABC transporter ATP-binding protein/permease [Gemmatimonadaceae bacterium]|nr:ABC transporter ATP-binding protein/permease [Gemmatimonadaceae bacterium]